MSDLAVLHFEKPQSIVCDAVHYRFFCRQLNAMIRSVERQEETKGNISTTFKLDRNKRELVLL